MTRDYTLRDVQKAINSYRAALQGMDRCYSRADFWNWEAVAAEAEVVLIDIGFLEPDATNGTLKGDNHDTR